MSVDNHRGWSGVSTVGTISAIPIKLKPKKAFPVFITQKILSSSNNQQRIKPNDKRWPGNDKLVSHVYGSCAAVNVDQATILTSFSPRYSFTVTKGKAVKANKTTAKKTTKNAAANTGNDKDVVVVIRDYLYEMYDAKLKEVSEDQLLLVTGYACADSKGFRIPVKTLVHELKHAAKDKKIFSLTAEGVRFMEANGGSSGSAKAVSNEDHHDKLKEKIHKLDSRAPMNKLDAIWQVLLDGKSHEQDELLESAGYKRPDSKGYAMIMKWLRKLELVTKEGTAFQFTNKVFPFGPPK